MRAGLTGLVLAAALAAQARAQQAPAGLCTADEVRLFGCMLKSRQQVGLCLARPDLKMRLVVRSGESNASSPLRNLREAAVGGTTRGDVVALRGNTDDGPVTLFVDFIAEDQVPPVLVMESGKQEIREVCASAAFEADRAAVTGHGGSRVAGLADLAEIGAAKPLTPAPDWPD